MKTLEKKSKRQLVKEYISNNNPYEERPKLGYKVREVSNYAKSKNCKITELSETELEQFRS